MSLGSICTLSSTWQESDSEQESESKVYFHFLVHLVNPNKKVKRERSQNVKQEKTKTSEIKKSTEVNFEQLSPVWKLNYQKYKKIK